ncbi:M42 family metallopeptidase [Natranaerobius trueperi]|uniref:Peptidase M42 n=1 Tax=Natranaerobius trueperi TaxID=759412 RepID=A0A226BVY7_9FIRM|nr:M42 family metallopeptidase [Natranaerobius trueperi]OWZ83153.1 peptidase M42 [Natranaerobius trueperi]
MEFNREQVLARLKGRMKSLSEAHGISGYENDVSNLIIDLLKDKIDTYEVDRLGNVIAFKKGNGKHKLMVTAHMDEIGLMIRRIDDNGFIWVDSIGGVRPQNLFSRPVTIKTESGYIKGIINHICPGRPEGISKVPSLDEFFIDVGVKNKDEVEQLGIEIGNPVIFEYEVRYLNNKITGKALDDRLCVFMLLELLEQVQDDKELPDLYAVFTTQEEVGCRGAKVAAHNIKPDAAIALDVSLANDHPATPDRKVITEMDKGPVIKVMDLIKGPMIGLISSQKLLKALKKQAKDIDLDYQLEVCTNLSTDAASIHLENGGVPSGAISVPCRYVHAYEMASIDDTLEGIKLLSEFVRNYPTDSIV